MAKSIKKYPYVKRHAPDIYDDIIKGALTFDDLDEKGNYKAKPFVPEQETRIYQGHEYIKDGKKWVRVKK